MSLVFLKNKIAILLFAVSFSFFNTFIYLYKRIHIEELRWISIFIVDVFVISYFVYYVVTKFFLDLDSKEHCEWNIISKTKKGENTDFKYFLIIGSGQFVCWLPVFFAYYPGLFAYDVMAQIPQTIGTYNTHHPLFHTLYLQFFYYYIGNDIFGNVNMGVAIATIVQMICFSLMLSYIHLYLYRSQICRSIRLIAILLTSFLPVFSMMAISLTKDIFFAGFVGLLFTSLCYKFGAKNLFDNSSLIKIVYLISIIGVILFRNNGIYPVLILSLYFFVKFKKLKKIALYTFAGLMLGILFQESLMYSLNASDGSINEMFSVPLQQIACAYIDNKESMNSLEIMEIEQYIPDVQMYNSALADPIKGTARVANDLTGFVRLWIKLGIKYPGSYIKSFILLNAGYLAITDISFAEIYGTDNRQGIFLTDTKQGFNVVHESKFPALENLYEYLFTSNNYYYVIGLNVLCSPAFYFWILVILFLRAFLFSIKGVFVPFLFLTVLIATFLLGPCSLIRYALPYIICIPSLFALIYTSLD